MKGSHNICKRCMETLQARRCFGPLKFDVGSETACCFCGIVIVAPETGAYTFKTFPEEPLVCNDEHGDEP